MTEAVGTGAMGAALLAAFSFLVGAVPFGPLCARRKGIDLRKTGSGNIGATNVLRAVGKKEALFTLAGDVLKGTAAVAVGMALGVGGIIEGMMGVAAIMGHDFSPFMRLRGGKGVATSLGVMLLYAPKAGILTLTVWIVTVALTRVSSMGALVSFAILPVGVALLGYGTDRVAVAVVISCLLFVRHSENIKRIINGSERKIGENA